MKVLVLNCGSSSIKYKLFDMTSSEVMAQGGIEKIGLPGAFLKLTDKDGKKVVLEKEIPGHKEGIEFILSILTDKTYGCIKEYNDTTCRPLVFTDTTGPNQDIATTHGSSVSTDIFLDAVVVNIQNHSSTFIACLYGCFQITHIGGTTDQAGNPTLLVDQV